MLRLIGPEKQHYSHQWHNMVLQTPQADPQYMFIDNSDPEYPRMDTWLIGLYVEDLPLSDAPVNAAQGTRLPSAAIEVSSFITSHLTANRIANEGDFKVTVPSQNGPSGSNSVTLVEVVLLPPVSEVNVQIQLPPLLDFGCPHPAIQRSVSFASPSAFKGCVVVEPFMGCFSVEMPPVAPGKMYRSFIPVNSRNQFKSRAGSYQGC